MNELEMAAKRLNDAARAFRDIAELPTKVGDRVEWVHNLLIWERKGDNAWLPISSPNGTFDNRDATPWPSGHVAQHPWVTVNRDEATPPNPTQPDFWAKVSAERERQIYTLGYEHLHDKKAGVPKLLMRAKAYATRGETLKAWALVQAAMDLAETTK